MAHVLRSSVRSSLPPAWANMTAVRVLEVNSNRLNGSLPDAWGTQGSFLLLRTMNLVHYLAFAKMSYSLPLWEFTFSINAGSVSSAFPAIRVA